MLKQLNASTFQKLSTSFEDSGHLWGIDPAYRNFSISNEALKLNLRIDFGTAEKMFSLLPRVLGLLLKNGDTIYAERQLAKRNNPNIKYEYFMRGWISSKNIKYYAVPAHIKGPLAKHAWNWDYKKCKSKKSFNEAIKSCVNLGEETAKWRCMYLDLSKRQYILVTFDTIMNQKKFDDFIDTLVLLKFKI